jgi:hypothetical protein
LQLQKSIAHYDNWQIRLSKTPQMNPEQQGRQQIDAMRATSGWVVQDYKAFHPSVARGIALRAYENHYASVAT